MSAFTVIGARRVGYDWRRQAVSSLEIGGGGWAQRANFALAGALYCVAAHGLARSPRRVVGPRAVPALVFAAGGGLVGSGVFVTDPMSGLPPSPGHRHPAGARRRPVPTRSGRLHTLCAIPVFAGIPAAAVLCAASAARRGGWRWASYSAGSALAMAGAFGATVAAFGGAAPLAGRGGVLQRVSIASGFGWLSALSLRVLASKPRA